MIDFENFVVEPGEIRQTHNYIKKECRPIHVKEIAELIVRNRLEDQPGMEGRRIYSPEQVYRVGEKIFFLQGNKIVFGEILGKECGHQDQYGPFDLIRVSTQGCEEEIKYVSNAPTVPARFKLPEKIDLYPEKPNIPVTPGQLVTKYEEKIIPNIERVLSIDENFVYFHKDWFIRDELPEIRGDEVESCCQYLKKRGAISASILVNNILKVSTESPKFAIFQFSLNYSLRNDPQSRFIESQSPEGIKWELKVALPPKTIRNTLTAAAITGGSIKITRGLRELLEYCNLFEDVTFTVYGGYEVHGYIDNSLNKIYGEELKTWFLENDLKPGSIIYINSPEIPTEYPTLYTFEKKAPDTIKGKEERIEKLKGRYRHRIYSLLKSEGQYVHVREIQRKIQESLSEKVELSTIEMILSNNKHIFARAPTSRGLWGLPHWAGKHADIDPISLSIAIREEDLVYRMLEKIGNFSTVEEIAKEIATFFLTHKDKVLEITFFEKNDERVIEADGKLGLRTWVEEWKKKIIEIDKEISVYRELLESQSKLKQVEKNKKIELLNLKQKKEEIQSLVGEIQYQIESVAEKISIHKKRQDMLQEELSILRKNRDNRKPRFLVYTFLSLSLVSLGLLIVSTEVISKSVGFILAFLAISCFLVVLWSERKSRRENRSLIIRKRNIEVTVNRIEEKLSEVGEKLRDLKEKKIRFQGHIGSLNQQIGEIIQVLGKLQDELKAIMEQIQRSNFSGLDAEKQQLIERLNLVGLEHP